MKQKKEKQIGRLHYLWLRIIIGFMIRASDRRFRRDRRNRLIIKVGKHYRILLRSELKKIVRLNKAGKTIREIEKYAIYKTYDNGEEH